MISFITCSCSVYCAYIRWCVVGVGYRCPCSLRKIHCWWQCTCPFDGSICSWLFEINNHHSRNNDTNLQIDHHALLYVEVLVFMGLPCIICSDVHISTYITNTHVRINMHLIARCECAPIQKAANVCKRAVTNNHTQGVIIWIYAKNILNLLSPSATSGCTLRST